MGEEERRKLPAHPYGAVYLRVNNPPEADWERDYKTASEDGNNIFRHWFLWSAIELVPGQYDFARFDRQLDLAAENGIVTVVAEMCASAPEWMKTRYPDARSEEASGKLADITINGSCTVGGISMCLDHPQVRKSAEAYLTRMASRYKDHPGMGAYDVWNECNHRFCYCKYSQARFREWLKDKYGTLEALKEAWYRPGILSWEDVTAPRELQPYPSSMDWLEFHVDKGIQDLRWRVQTLRAADPNHRITAHGLSASFQAHPYMGCDDWRSAAEVESYGLTWGAQRHGNDPWIESLAMDECRCAARGKTVWHAENYGGPLWYAPEIPGRAREDGREIKPEDLRYYTLTGYMHGMRGTLFLRWRPLLSGPLFGAFGPYGMDGSRTDRSRMSTKICRFLNAPETKALRQSRPLQGEIGILFAPESEDFVYLLRGSTEPYRRSIEGAYRGFYARNIQADLIKIEDLSQYPLVYLPYPLMLKDATIDAILRYVEKGGTLISEVCPGYFNERCAASPSGLPPKLQALFGASEAGVEFAPDLLAGEKVTIFGKTALGGEMMQSYDLQGGECAGTDEEGRIRAVTHRYGQGKTLLLGASLGAGIHACNGDKEGPVVFDALLAFGGSAPRIRSANNRIILRISEGVSDGTTHRFLFAANPLREPVSTEVKLDPSQPVTGEPRILWGEGARAIRMKERTLQLELPARDVLILEI